MDGQASRSVHAGPPAAAAATTARTSSGFTTTVIYESDNRTRMILWSRGGVVLAGFFTLSSLFELTYEPLEPLEMNQALLEARKKADEKPWYRQPVVLTYLCTGFSYAFVALGWLYSKRYVESISLTQDAKLLVSNIRLQTYQFFSGAPRAPIDFPVRHLKAGRSLVRHKTITFRVEGHKGHYLIERDQLVHDPEMVFAVSQGGKHVDALTRTRYAQMTLAQRGARGKSRHSAPPASTIHGGHVAPTFSKT
ncbi:hypothetical protein FVE85_4736 [Porphyridium purpureum]|uniref:Transmembrane protein n=1 Tax=Porphyridium purpureum TaxID=35688 RepID=A0A5J4YQ77_PORPP|nr:hypothetical protein FVE85_4736 [Porphyridium purpureum]|eukprot:POR5590..scf236_6